MGWETASGPDQVPLGGMVEQFWTSLRAPEVRFRLTLLAPAEIALRTAVPDSSLEPAMYCAVPVRVTSDIDYAPPQRYKRLLKQSGCLRGRNWDLRRRRCGLLSHR